MNIQTIAIKKLNKILLPLSNNNDINIKMQLQSEAMKLGFVFTEDAVSALASNIDSYESIFTTLNELVGANKTWKPFYQNFPNEVFEKRDIELYLNAITHYMSCGVWRLEENVSQKVPTFENVKFKTIGLCDDNDINDLFKSIVSSNGSITEFDKQVIVYAIKNWDKNWLNSVNIVFKETLCFLVGLLYEYKININNFPVKTATDVLRIATHFSKGDISLAEKTRYKLKNAERKFIVKLLERVIKEEEIAKYKSEWVKLFHHLHIGSYRDAKKCNDIAKKLRESKIRSLNSNVEIALRDKDLKSLLIHLPKNMGDFGRRLDHILRMCSKDGVSGVFLDIFNENISKIDSRVLLQILSHFKYRNQREMRVVIPKGITKNARILPIHEKISDDILENIAFLITDELKRRYSEKTELKNVYIDETLKKAPIPMQMRTASDGLYVVQRGTRIPLDNDNSILRFFIHWIGDDIDLSACFLKEDLSHHSAVTYYNLRNTDGILSAHSGDITYAPKPNGACEFIDIDLDSITDESIRYIAMDVRVFRGDIFEKQQANAGWMMRNKIAAERGEIFDARTVEQRISLSSKNNCIVMLFDVKNREFIWLDMEGQSSTFNGGNNVESNKASIKQIAQIAIEPYKISLYDLLKLHAESRGCLVDNIEDADIIYEKDWIFRYNEILSEYI